MKTRASRLVFGALAGTAFLGLQACTSAEQHGGTGSPRGHAQSMAERVVDGPVKGRFMAVGGPCCLPTRPMAGTGTVTFTNMRSGESRTLETHADGTYRGVLPVGTYAVAGTISNYQGGHAPCSARSHVVVRVTGSTHADVYCQER